MIVAGPRAAQLGVARPGADARVPGAGGERNEPLKGGRDACIRETEIAVPPLALDGDEAGIFELRQVPADGREHEPGFLGRMRAGS